MREKNDAGSPHQARRHRDGATPYNLRQFITSSDWGRLILVLRLSEGQAEFLWAALENPREKEIALALGLSQYAAHARRVALFRKLRVDSMSQALLQVFAAYLELMQATATSAARQLSN